MTIRLLCMSHSLLACCAYQTTLGVEPITVIVYVAHAPGSVCGEEGRRGGGEEG